MREITFEGCRGWLHEGRSGRGVVLCTALGFEGFCGYRPWYQLAEELAAAGSQVLRFDYPSTGDSVGDERDPGRVDAWLASIHQAIDCLRREADVTEIFLVGLRFGASLAMQVASERNDIAGLALLAPAASGRSHARELTIQSHMILESPDAPLAAAPLDDGIDIRGFVHTNETLAAMSRIDLHKLNELGADRILLLHESATTAPARLVERLSRPGRKLDVLAFAGYDVMIGSPMQATRPGAWDDVVEWASRDLPARTGAARALQPVLPLIGQGWEETVIRFGPAESLIGILCRPLGPVADVPLVIHANAGRDARMGAGRGTTERARHLARSGVASFRYDSAGFGDSRMLSDRQCEPLYSPGMIEDARFALNRLQALGYERFTFAGVCSGAYVALHLARDDERIAGIIAINLSTFEWQPGDSIDLVLARTPRRYGDYLKLAFRPAAWRRVFTGEVNLLVSVFNFVRHVGATLATKLGHSLAALFGLRTKTTRIRSWFRQFSQRRVGVLMLYSDNDPGLFMLDRYMGRAGRWLSRLDGVEVAMMPNADHMLTLPTAREQTANSILRFLKRVK